MAPTDPPVGAELTQGTNVRKTLLTTLIAVSLLLAACGDDDSGSNATATTTTTTAADGSSTTAANKDPVKMGLLGVETGPNASEDRHDTIELAIDELGSAGGHPLEYSAYDAQYTPDAATLAVKKAISDGMNVLIGPIVTAQIKALAPILKDSGIPIVHSAQSPEVNFDNLGIENAFRMNVPADEQTAALIKYVVEELKPQTVGLLASSDDNSKLSGDLIQKGLEDAGITVTRREVPADSTDLTEAVLAFQDVDVTVSWSFPQIESLFLRQRAQHGITVPEIASVSGSVLVNQGLNTPEEFTGYHYVSQCDGDVADTPTADQFRTTYEAKYPGGTALSAPTNYDSVRFIAAAIEKAGSLDPSAIVKAMGEVSVDGVCGTLKSDSKHDLMHDMMIVSADGGKANKELAATYSNLGS